MTTSAARNDADDILNIVIKLLEDHGYDNWQLRDVAEQAHASLATIYKHFRSREDLVVAAVERWMEENIYRPFHQPSEGEPLFESLSRMFHTILEPWEQHPTMLNVFVRACSTKARDRLRAQGTAAIAPLSAAYERELEGEFQRDVTMILTNVVEGALTRYVNGEIAVTDILPTLERTLHRLEQAAQTEQPGAKRRRAAAPNHAPRGTRTVGRR